MSRQAMIIDMERCVGCGACAVACEAEWELPLGVRRAWVLPLWPVAGPGAPVFTHFVGQCNHCAKAPCLPACPTGATYRDAKGRIRVDAKACVGCGYCVSACPFGARMLRADGGRVEKCDFCAPLVDAGGQPACVRTCPAGARVFGDLDDREGLLARHFRTHRVERLETADVAVGPHVYYSGEKAVLARIVASHPPRPSGLHPPLPGRLLRDVLKPGFLAMAALAAVGVVATLARQIRRGDRGGEKERRPSGAARGAGAETAAEAETAETLHRHDAVIIGLHWCNALVWLFQACTGFALLGKSAYRVTPPVFDEVMLAAFGSHATLLRAHIVVGIVWTAVLVLYGVFGLRRYLLPFLGSLRLASGDLRWLRLQLTNVFARTPRALPPQDKFNAGQKICGMIVSAGTVVIVVSGLILWLLPSAGADAYASTSASASASASAVLAWAIPIHFLAAAGVLLMFSVHVTVVLLLPEERPALWSMLTGRISADYAREHNTRWWERQQKKSGRGGS